MSYQLIQLPAFIKSAKKLIRKNADSALDLRETLVLLSQNPNTPSLRTHKLKGNLAGSLACSVGYDLRIIFSYGEHEGKPAIILKAMGTHYEVY